MKWVTRKSFTLLSKRQQYARLSLQRGFRSLEQSDIQLKSNQPEYNQQSLIIGDQPMQCDENECDIPANENVGIPINYNVVEQNVEHPAVQFEEKIDAEILNCGTRETILEKENVDTFTNFQGLLRQCCLNMNFNHIQINALLQVLRTHKCLNKLPKDSRTLLKTNREIISFLPIGDGIYWHIGFARSLQKQLLNYDPLPKALDLQINTDGLSLTKSDPNTYWPIQIKVTNIPNMKPIIVGIYKGSQKPSDGYELFKSLINEVEATKRLGGILVRNQRIPFSFKTFIADAPARALILNHYGHNSTCPCSKCKVAGYRYENRIMVYLGTNHEKRTDDEYITKLDEDHQKGYGPLIELGIPPVTKSVFDIMHLVYLGVTVRLLDAWFNGKFGYRAKLPIQIINEISSRFLNLKDVCPVEFARRPRSLTKFNKFKATELRHFLLYASPVVLKEKLSDELYYHFLHLHVSMRLLTSPNLTKENLSKAESALKLFVEFAPDLYTPAFVSYNVHALQHLADDAREFGPLENCSAFVFENNMPLFKKNIRNHPRPLQQFANRLQEKNYMQHNQTSRVCSEKVSVLHNNGPLPDDILAINCKQFRQFQNKKFKLKLDAANSYCMLEDKSMCKIENILTINEKVSLLIRKFEIIEDFYLKPIKSSLVGTYKCRKLSEKKELVLINNILAKCYCISSYSSTSNTGLSFAQEDEKIISTVLHSCD